MLVKTNAADPVKKGTMAQSYHQHFLSVRRTPKAVHYAASQSMNVSQFVQVMKEVANKMYASVLEQQTCTTLEYLSASQRAVASRAAMELLIQHKVFPTADRMGLIPWPLLNLDKTLSISYEGSPTYKILALMAEPIETWYLLYLPKSKAGGSEDSREWSMTYKCLSRFAHDLDIVPGLFNEPQLYSLFEEILRW